MPAQNRRNQQAHDVESPNFKSPLLNLSLSILKSLLLSRFCRSDPFFIFIYRCLLSLFWKFIDSYILEDHQLLYFGSGLKCQDQLLYFGSGLKCQDQLLYFGSGLKCQARCITDVKAGTLSLKEENEVDLDHGKSGDISFDALSKAKATLLKLKKLAEKMKKIPC